MVSRASKVRKFCPCTEGTCPLCRDWEWKLQRQTEKIEADTYPRERGGNREASLCCSWDRHSIYGRSGLGTGHTGEEHGKKTNAESQWVVWRSSQRQSDIRAKVLRVPLRGQRREKNRPGIEGTFQARNFHGEQQ